MNDLKTIANLMKMATESVLHPKFKEMKDLKDFTCRVGSGAATNVKSHNRGFGYKYILTYGLKMLESKQTKKKALGWTTGKEITKRKYFKDPSFKNLVVATILHEYAHVIQVQDGKREYRGMHNDYFYEVLDGFYDKGFHVELDKYLSAFPAYNEAKYTDTRRSLTKLDLVGAEYAEIEGKNSNFTVKIIKLNPKRVVYLQKNGLKGNAPYAMVKCTLTEKEADFTSTPRSSSSKNKLNSNGVTSKLVPMDFGNKINQSTFIRERFKFIKTKERSGMKYYQIKKSNPKNVVAESLENGNTYNVPYGMIVEGLKELPDGIKKRTRKPELSQSPEEKYSNPKYKFVKTSERGEKYYIIEGCNKKTLSGRDISTGNRFRIPYGMIIEGLEELPKGFEISKEANESLENTYDQDTLSQFNYIDIKMSGDVVKFEVIKCNPKKVKARIFNTKSVYTIPYSNILKAYN